MPLPKGQDWLISRMQKLGYKAASEGVCFGLAHMAMQAIQADEIDLFDKRLEKINSLSLDSLVQTINDLKEKRTKTKNLPIDPLLEIPAFFEGVELYQQAYLYPFLFEKQNKPTTQNAMAVAPLIQPQVLKENNIEIGKPAIFTGVYNQEELIEYLHSLRNAIQQSDPPLLKPFTMILTSGNHTITVAYDPKKDEWLFIDPNELPTQHISGSEDTIANKVLSAFSSNGMTIFRTEIYTTNTNKTAIEACVNNWKQQDVWKKIHTVSTNKAAAVDSCNASWLYIAAQEDQLETVKALLNAGARVNLARTDNGTTALYIAAQFGQLETVKALLDAGARVNLARTNGSTALLIAAQYGYLEIVTALLAAGANVNLARTDNGSTALFNAAQNGHSEIVTALLTAGANVNLARINGATALYVAAQNGNLEIVTALLNAGARVNLARTNGSTPLYAAAQKGHFEIVNALLIAGADVNLACTNGATALSMAAQEGHFDIVRLLLSKGAKIDAAFKNDAQSLRKFSKKYNNVNIESRMNALIKKKRCTSTLSITSEEIATVMGHSEIKETLIKFKKLDEFALNLRKIARTYHSKTLFHSENEERENSIKKIAAATDEAYRSFANGIEIEEIINTLRGKAEEISRDTKKDHNKGFVSSFFTKSRLANKIDAALPSIKTMS